MKPPYLTVEQTAARWHVSGAMIRKYLAAGRIPGAIKIGAAWLIPRDAKKPAANATGPKPA